MANKKPRRLELNSNLVRYNEKTISHNNYHECFEGIIHSFAERYPFNEQFATQVKTEWEHTAQYLKVQPEE
jgi:hypothetical protein